MCSTHGLASPTKSIYDKIATLPQSQYSRGKPHTSLLQVQQEQQENLSLIKHHELGHSNKMFSFFSVTSRAVMWAGGLLL